MIPSTLEDAVSKFVLRRTKKDLNINIPHCDIQKVEIPLSDAEREFYEKLQKRIIQTRSGYPIEEVLI